MTAGPLRGNRTWQVSEHVLREQLTGGFYRYWTPYGCLALAGDTGRWVITGFDGQPTAPQATLADADAVVRDTIAQVTATLAGAQ